MKNQLLIAFIIFFASITTWAMDGNYDTDSTGESDGHESLIPDDDRTEGNQRDSLFPRSSTFRSLDDDSKYAHPSFDSKTTTY